MSSGKRISIALVGLVLLAVIGWLVTDRSDGTQGGHGPAVSTVVSTPVTLSPSAPRPADASG